MYGTLGQTIRAAQLIAARRRIDHFVPKADIGAAFRLVQSEPLRSPPLILDFHAQRDHPMDQIDGPEPLTKIRTLLRQTLAVRGETVSSAPNWTGAYAVVMHLSKPVRFDGRRLSQNLDAGWYAYAGSAYGPGGIRARLRRHFKKEKKLHWHVDHLTAVADDIHAVAVRNGSECEIIAQLTRSRVFWPVADGFGSSDCEICKSHLLEWRRK